jgi:hypothetical protein
MGQELIFKNENISIWYHDDFKIIHHKFHKFTTGKILKESLNKELEAIRKYSVVKILSDDKENPIMKKEDMEWTASEWRPAVIKEGWKFWAIVLPEQTAGQMALKKIISEYAKTGVTVQAFTDSNAAFEWIKQQ